MEWFLTIIASIVAAAAGGFAFTLTQKREELKGLLTDARRRGKALEDKVREAAQDRDSTVRRVREQASEAKRFAHEPMARDLLEVLDNFERALEGCQDASSAVEEGVRLTHGQLLQVLHRHGIERLSSVGEPFDPSLHEAVGTAPSLEVAEHHVLREWVAAYRLHGRLLRPAKVILAVPPPEIDEAEVTEGAAEPALASSEE